MNGFLYLVMVLFSVGFVVRMVCALFSRRISDRVREESALHALWFLLVLVTFYYSLTWFLVYWPPRWLERISQRREVVQRLNDVGGWEALTRDCALVCKQHSNGVFQWYRWPTNTTALSPALAALKPRRVEFIAPEFARQNRFADDPEPSIVKIQIFGAHSTGGHSIPFYDLWVLGEPNTNSFRPKWREVGAKPRGGIKKITSEIFEAY